MKLLLTNDDGIASPGLRLLARVLCDENQVTVLAPDRERSAASHSMTFTSPLIPKSAKYFDFLPKERTFTLNGTPVDCVKVAGFADFGLDFDLVVSGINIGPNIGTDVLYSGTAAAAVEGIIIGKRGVALSLNSHDPQHLEETARLAAKIIGQIDFSLVPADTALNINFPDVSPEEIRGVASCSLGVVRYVDELSPRTHPFGYGYYWMSGRREGKPEEDSTDMYYIERNYVTITPVVPDLTNYRALELTEQIAREIQL